MYQTPFTGLAGFIVLIASSALAQTTPGTGAGTGAGTAAGSGGLADWWWVILVALLAAAAIWYFMRARGRP